MVNPFKFGLRSKLNLIVAVVLAVTMTIFEGMSLHHEKELLIDARAHHLRELAQHFGWVVRNAASRNEQNLVMDYERALNGNENQDYRALILDAHSQVIAATNPGLMGTVISDQALRETYERLTSDGPAQVFVRGTSRMLVALPISIRSDDPRPEDRFVTVVISSPLDEIRQSLNSSLMTHAVHLLITALAMIGFINIALTKLVLQPIKNLLADMRQMARGEWARELPVQRNDEIGELTAGYNALGRNLEASVRHLVKAEKLASVALVAIHLNRGLKNPISRIRECARFLSRRNAFDADSAHAVGRIFDETGNITAISEKFNQSFSTYCPEAIGPFGEALSPEPESDNAVLSFERRGEVADDAGLRR